MTNKQYESHSYLTYILVIFSLCMCVYAVYRELSSESHKILTTTPAISQTKELQYTLETYYDQKWPRSELMATSILMASTVEAIPTSLIVAVIQTESTMIPRSNPKSGAIGFMQVKPAYWEEQCGQYQMKDTYQNILAGSCILNHLVVEFGSIRKALVVYNIGRGNYHKGKLIAEGNAYADKVLTESNLFDQRLEK